MKRLAGIFALFVLLAVFQCPPANATSPYDNTLALASSFNMSCFGVSGSTDMATTWLPFALNADEEYKQLNNSTETRFKAANDIQDQTAGVWAVSAIYWPGNSSGPYWGYQIYAANAGATYTLATNSYGYPQIEWKNVQWMDYDFIPFIYKLSDHTTSCDAYTVATYGGSYRLVQNSVAQTNSLMTIEEGVDGQDSFFTRAFQDNWEFNTAAFEPPTGYAGLQIPTNYIPPPATYVAMGDSFSSGEGNSPFETGSDSSSDKCHRSPQAYPRLLDSDASLDLGPMAFVACSGAMTSDLFSQVGPVDPEGNWGEAPQISALSADTQTVTITIGGNDVGFASYAETCAASACGPGTTWYQDIVDAINSTDFTTRLENAYSAILSTAENAEVYVIDYPYISAADATWCGAMDFSGARSVQTLLNSTIALAVADVGDPRLHYVSTNGSSSPFDGKHLCNGGVSDFNGFTLPKEYSFHPNQQGQEDYAAVVEAAMS